MNRKAVFLLGASLVALVVILMLAVNTEPPTPDEELERAFNPEEDSPGATGPTARPSEGDEGDPATAEPSGPRLVVAVLDDTGRPLPGALVPVANRM